MPINKISFSSFSKILGSAFCEVWTTWRKATWHIKSLVAPMCKRINIWVLKCTLKALPLISKSEVGHRLDGTTRETKWSCCWLLSPLLTLLRLGVWLVEREKVLRLRLGNCLLASCCRLILTWKSCECAAACYWRAEYFGWFLVCLRIFLNFCKLWSFKLLSLGIYVWISKSWKL